MRTTHASVNICWRDMSPESETFKMTSFLPLLALFGAGVSGVYGACQQGWVRHDNSCYFFSRDSVSWEDASTFCSLISKNANGYLVEIDDNDEEAFVENQTKLHNADAWIGATDLVYEGEFIWMKSKTPVRTARWGDGEPNNAGTNEDCVLMWLVGKWNDAPCSTTIRYICEENYIII